MSRGADEEISRTAIASTELEVGAHCPVGIALIARRIDINVLVLAKSILNREEVLIVG
jgi:ABC-type taurine transport system substrate-binding protein